MTPADRVPPLVAETLTPEAFSGWFEKHEPNAIVPGNTNVYQWLLHAGVSVPDQVGFGHTGVRRDSFYSGIWQNTHRDERDVPGVRCSFLVDASWVEGKTIRGVGSAQLVC